MHTKFKTYNSFKLEKIALLYTFWAVEQLFLPIRQNINIKIYFWKFNDGKNQIKLIKSVYFQLMISTFLNFHL